MHSCCYYLAQGVMLGQLKIRKISLDDPLLPFLRHLYYTHCKWISLQICRSSWVFCFDFSIFLSLCVFGFGGLCWVFQDRAISLVYGHPIWRSLCLASWVFSFLRFFFWFILLLVQLPACAWLLSALPVKASDVSGPAVFSLRQVCQLPRRHSSCPMRCCFP